MAETQELRNYLSSPNGFTRTSFGELSVGEIEAQAAWNFQYNVNASLINSVTANNGSVSSSSAQAILQTSTATNGSAEISTINVLRHVPGVSAICRFTAIFTTGVANNTQIVGIGDTNDGFYFGYNGVNFGILRRQNGSDNWINQSAWNNMKISSFDPTKGNVYQIKFQWLGYGQVDFFIENQDSGNYEIVHSIKYTNQNTVPSIFSPSLPLNAKVLNSGNTSNITLKTASGMIGLEGKIHEGALQVLSAASNTVLTLSSERPILTIKNSTNHINIPNRQRIKVNQISLALDGAKNGKFSLYKNATLSSSVNYTLPSSNTTPFAKDIGSTSNSGGVLIAEYFLGKAESKVIEMDTMSLYLVSGDTLTITGQSTANTDASATINVKTLF